MGVTGGPDHREAKLEKMQFSCYTRLSVHSQYCLSSYLYREKFGIAVPFESN